MHIRFRLESLKEKGLLRRSRRRWDIKMKQNEGVDQIHVAQVTDKWWDFVMTAMNTRAP